MSDVDDMSQQPPGAAPAAPSARPPSLPAAPPAAAAAAPRQEPRASAASAASAAPSTLSADEVEEQLEWEEYRATGGFSFAKHMVAGSCAGVAEHLCMYPVDTFKVRHGRRRRDYAVGVRAAAARGRASGGGCGRGCGGSYGRASSCRAGVPPLSRLPLPSLSPPLPPQQPPLARRRHVAAATPGPSATPAQPVHQPRRPAAKSACTLAAYLHPRGAERALAFLCTRTLPRTY